METSPKLILPTAPISPSNRYVDQKILHIGPAGCGKSEFWSIGNHLFIDLEGNLRHLNVRRVACRSWSALGDIFLSLWDTSQNGQPFPYDGVVIDTGDQLALLAGEEIVERARQRFKTHANEIHVVSDIGDGKMGWYQQAHLVHLFLNKFSLLPCAKIIIFHDKESTVELPTKAKFTRYGLSVGGQTGDAFINWANHVLHMRPQGGGDIILPDTPLRMRTLPTLDIEAKSHGSKDCPPLPDGIPWQLAQGGKQLDAELNWRTFRALFG